VFAKTRADDRAARPAADVVVPKATSGKCCRARSHVLERQTADGSHAVYHCQARRVGSLDADPPSSP
jgi:hypothetical protein